MAAREGDTVDDGAPATVDGVPALLGGRFLLGELLGRGSSAAVHRARDEVLGRDVAVKLFPAELGPAEAARIAHEMYLLAGLEHPGVVSVYDVGEVAGRPYMVMRLVEGGTLADLIATGPLPVPEVLLLAGALLGALAYVHRHGVVHQDVKPGNVLLTTDPVSGALVPLLGDFGIASHPEDPSAGSTPVPDIILGTPAYLPPERVAGGPAEPAGDVYALGLVLVEAVTGRPEYSGLPEEAALAHLDRDPVVPADLPVELAELLRAMTAREPADRPTPVAAAAVVTRLARRLASDGAVRPARGRGRDGGGDPAGGAPAGATTLLARPGVRSGVPPPRAPATASRPPGTAAPATAATTSPHRGAPAPGAPARGPTVSRAAAPRPAPTGPRARAGLVGATVALLAGGVVAGVLGVSGHGASTPTPTAAGAGRAPASAEPPSVSPAASPPSSPAPSSPAPPLPTAAAPIVPASPAPSPAPSATRSAPVPAARTPTITTPAPVPGPGTSTPSDRRPRHANPGRARCEAHPRLPVCQ